MFLPKPGLVVGNRYSLTQAIGRGGMGEVWQAHDLELDTPCAVKFILQHLATDRGIRDRFAREARAVARLRSPHVVQILGVGEVEDVPYLAMELLDGETLLARLDRLGKLDPAVTVKVVEQVAEALESAHEAGIVHRDLKPENIWFWAGSKVFIKVLDFGVAKTGLKTGSLQTATGALVGTPQYMSPEQALGNRDVDHRSDLWSLAVITVECLCGKRPFDSEGLGDLLLKIVSNTPPSLHELAPELPLGLHDWWARALARDPRDRYQSASELVEALRPHLVPMGAPYSSELAHSGLAHSGLAHSGLAHSGLQNAGLAHAGLPHSGLQNAGFPNSGSPHVGLPHSHQPHSNLPHSNQGHGGLPHSGALPHSHQPHSHQPHSGALPHSGAHSGRPFSPDGEPSAPRLVITDPGGRVGDRHPEPVSVPAIIATARHPRATQALPHSGPLLSAKPHSGQPRIGEVPSGQPHSGPVGSAQLPPHSGQPYSSQPLSSQPLSGPAHAEDPSTVAGLVSERAKRPSPGSVGPISSSRRPPPRNEGRHRTVVVAAALVTVGVVGTAWRTLSGDPSDGAVPPPTASLGPSPSSEPAPTASPTAAPSTSPAPADVSPAALGKPTVLTGELRGAPPTESPWDPALGNTKPAEPRTVTESLKPRATAPPAAPTEIAPVAGADKATAAPPRATPAPVPSPAAPPRAAPAPQPVRATAPATAPAASKSAATVAALGLSAPPPAKASPAPAAKPADRTSPETSASGPGAGSGQAESEAERKAKLKRRIGLGSK